MAVSTYTQMMTGEKVRDLSSYSVFKTNSKRYYQLYFYNSKELKYCPKTLGIQQSSEEPGGSGSQHSHCRLCQSWLCLLLLCSHGAVGIDNLVPG